MDYALRKSLCALIEEATTTGEEKLRPEHVSHLKKFLRRGKEEVEVTFEVIMKQLRKNHSQVRLLAWQLISYMFTRSKHVRTLVEKQLPEILKLVVGDKSSSLPLPKAFAVLLQSCAMQDFKIWAEKYPEMVRLNNAEQYISLQATIISPPQSPMTSSIPATPSTPITPSAVSSRPGFDKETLLRDIEEIKATLSSLKSCFNLLYSEFMENGEGLFTQNAVEEDDTEEDSNDVQWGERECKEIKEKETDFDQGQGGDNDFYDLQWEEGKEKDEDKEIKEKDEDCDFDGIQWEEGEEKTQKEANEKETEDYDFDDVQWEDGETVDAGKEESEEDIILVGGLGCSSYTLDISVNTQETIKETEDNKEICDTLRVGYKQLNMHSLPLLLNYLDPLRQAGEIELVSEVGNLMGEVKQMLEVVAGLGITPLCTPTKSSQSTPESTKSTPKSASKSPKSTPTTSPNLTRPSQASSAPQRLEKRKLENATPRKSNTKRR
eukprot:TRINITY_DN463_c0_g1_i6.p1 TRINITY_DN463_c0_g1~~TRINITY_DN463_c0_g1_i6.p1  ORF type:complete len:492 (-),score=120.01 TRINITY_DN463_c0_g1_i6:516-1991(-)